MGWDILSWSYSVVRKDLKLLLFPVMSVGGAGLAALLFLQFRLFYGLNYAALFLWYVAATFLMVFFNCALAACALAHFAGRPASLGYGLGQAAARVSNIFLWALLSSTVGILIRMIDRRLSLAGKIAVWLFGAAWGMATFLVVPILVVEDMGPVEALKRSAEMLRKSWGDQLTARIRLGWFGLLLFAPALLLGIAGAFRAPLFWAAAIVYGGLVAAFITASQGVFQAAMYRQLTTGQAPAGLADVLGYRTAPRFDGR